jgi:hypothetical protein
MRKQRKMGEDVEVGDGGDHKKVKGDQEMATQAVYMKREQFSIISLL